MNPPKKIKKVRFLVHIRPCNYSRLMHQVIWMIGLASHVKCTVCC